MQIATRLACARLPCSRNPEACDYVNKHFKCNPI